MEAKRELKKFREFLKKGVDKREGICYITQAVREGAAINGKRDGLTPGGVQKNLKIFLKKVLTNP